MSDLFSDWLGNLAHWSTSNFNLKGLLGVIHVMAQKQSRLIEHSNKNSKLTLESQNKRPAVP